MCSTPENLFDKGPTTSKIFEFTTTTIILIRWGGWREGKKRGKGRKNNTLIKIGNEFINQV